MNNMTISLKSMFSLTEPVAVELLPHVDFNFEANGYAVDVSTVGSFEEMVTWRQKYLDWLDNAALCGNFRVRQSQVSRTWTLTFEFEDKGDALLFKLTWG
jgi:hypothetical protein